MEMKMKKRILLIDDSELVRFALRRAFEDKGYDVIVADGGEKGIEIVSKNPTFFDLVITDYQMPGIQGDEVVRLIKRRFPQLRVVFMTSDLWPTLTETAKSAGADLVLEKSGDMPEMIHRFLERR